MNLSSSILGRLFPYFLLTAGALVLNGFKTFCDRSRTKTQQHISILFNCIYVLINVLLILFQPFFSKFQRFRRHILHIVSIIVLICYVKTYSFNNCFKLKQLLELFFRLCHILRFWTCSKNQLCHTSYLRSSFFQQFRNQRAVG